MGGNPAAQNRGLSTKQKVMILAGAALLTRHQFTRKSVRLKKSLDRSLPPIRADKTRIERTADTLIDEEKIVRMNSS